MTIDTRELLQLDNAAVISVNGGIIGLPDNIILRGRDFALNQESTISATTNLGGWGNISLQGERLFLGDRSSIATIAIEEATGGNILIELESNLLALEDSKITASAEQRQGGNIQISAKGIFLSANSEIIASSKFGVDGLIQIDTLTVDPNSGLVLFPTEPIDPNL